MLGASVIIAGIVSAISPRSNAFLWCVAVAQIGGGIALLFRRSAPIGAVAVGAAYLALSLACIPGMIVKADNWLQYVDFFERFSIVCGTIALYATVTPKGPQTAPLRTFARIGLAICVASFAWAQVVYLQHTASLVPAWIPPSQVFWTNLTTVAFALAAIAILINVRAGLAINLTVTMLALFGVLVWVPLLAEHPQTLGFWREIAGNYAIMAAVWAVK